MADRFPDHADLIKNPLIRLQLELALSGQMHTFSKGDFSNDEHYQVLGVTKSASHAECKAAYRAAALRSHTDKIKKESDTIRLLNEAKGVLLDDTGSKRPLYDRFGKAGLALLTLLEQAMTEPQFAKMAEMMKAGTFDPFGSDFFGDASNEFFI